MLKTLVGTTMVTELVVKGVGENLSLQRVDRKGSVRVFTIECQFD